MKWTNKTEKCFNLTFTRWSMASGKNTRSIPAPRTISLNCERNISSLSSNSFQFWTGSYTLGSSMSASSPSSPVGSGASLYFSQNKWCQSLRKYLLLMARDITNTMYIETQVNCLHSFELSVVHYTFHKQVCNYRTLLHCQVQWFY